jgi:hypothetical protein
MLEMGQNAFINIEGGAFCCFMIMQAKAMKIPLKGIRRMGKKSWRTGPSLIDAIAFLVLACNRLLKIV